MNNIDLILETVQTSSFIGKFVKLKPLRGRTFIGLCPFHKEKTPSFRVDDEKKFFYCFGCNKGGNVLNFLQDYKGVSFIEALNSIAEEYNLSLTKYDKKESETIQEEKSITQKVMDIFTSYLHTSKGLEALNYLKNKRNLSPETIKNFKIGLCPQEGDFLVSYFPDKIEELIKLGIIGKKQNGGFYSSFSSRIIFPIFNKSNDVIAFAGRIFLKNQEESKLAKYINSKESTLFKKSSTLYGVNKLKNTKNSIIIVEGYLDVIKMHQHGFMNVVAQMGTALSSQNIEALFLKTDEIIFCYDSDNAGKKAELKSIEICLPLISPSKKISFIELDAKDVDEFLEQYGTAQMAQKIELKIPLFQKIFNHFTNKVNFKDPNQNAKCEDNLNNFCKNIKNEIVKKSYQSYFKNQLFQLRTQKNTVSKQNIINNLDISFKDAKLFALFLKFPDFFKQDYYFEHFVPFESRKLQNIVDGLEENLELQQKIKLLYPLIENQSPEEIFQQIYNDYIIGNLIKERSSAIKNNNFIKVKQINEELNRLKNRT